MFRDKWVLRFYVILIIFLFVVYYNGESRNREMRKLGFTICEINGIDTWSTSCPEETGFLSKNWSK